MVPHSGDSGHRDSEMKWKKDGGTAAVSGWILWQGRFWLDFISCSLPLHQDTTDKALSDTLIKDTGIRQTKVQRLVALTRKWA